MSKAMEDFWEQGGNEGIKQAIEQGIRIGEERVARRAALHLLLNKKHRCTIDEIAYISGLSIEEIKRLEACDLKEML